MPRRTLRDEIRQTRPFRSSAQEAALGLLRTADAVSRRFAAVVQPFGITPQQYNVLRILRGAGAEGLTTLDVAERMIEQAPGITGLIDRLEAAGLVARERCTEDRRAVWCRATRKGLALLAELDPVVNAADDDVLAMLTESEQRSLVRLLDKIRAATPAAPSPRSPSRSRKEPVP